MFFVLSKLLTFFLQPFVWFLILLILGVWMKKPKLKKNLLKLALLVLLFFSNTVIFSEFTRLWEVKGLEHREVSTYDIAIVLGGMSEYNTDLKRLSIRRGGDRIWQTIQLYQQGKIDKILISGANGHLVDKGLVEATQMKSDLIRMGISETDILTESKSRNTHENAVETKKIIDSLEFNPNILLVTSALHMKRAEACFRAVEFENYDCFTTDHFTGRKRGYHFDQFLIPDVGTLTSWNYLIKEWVGYIMYALMGYI